MTRSVSALEVSKTKTSRYSSKSSVAPPTSSIPANNTKKPLKVPHKSSASTTTHNSQSSSIDYELNSALRSLVDGLCDVFVDARQSGMNEAQTVELLLDYFILHDQDPSQIFEWLQNNTHKSKYTTLLGYFYDQGIANARNQRKAYCLYLSAAKKDYRIAQDLLGDCYYSGQGTTKNRNLAFEWYHKAADNGSTGSQFSLGICYAIGDGTPKNRYKAFLYYKKSANGGNVSGKNELGYCYEMGVGTKKDINKAFLLFEQAAEGGNPPGQHNLASCYEEGKGTKKDIDKAIYWYQKSADNGHELAEKRLNQLLKLIREQENDEFSDISSTSSIS